MNKGKETKQKTVIGGNEKASMEKFIKTNQKKDGQPPAKRTHSEVSNCSTEELSCIQLQLEQMSESLTEVRGDLKTLMKKEDIENLITTTVTNIMENLEKKMTEYINSKINGNLTDLQDKIHSLEFENADLKSKIDHMETKLDQHVEKTQKELENNKAMAKEAIKKANYNEQYSRKNNIKILNVPEKKDETEEVLTLSVQDILKKHEVSLSKDQILAIHRIPGRNGTKPVLLKLKNNNAKIKIMRIRKVMKEDGHRLIDDVTQLNHGLLNRLSLHPDIKTSWFFNGSVYGSTSTGRRYKFDIYDNISSIIT